MLKRMKQKRIFKVLFVLSVFACGYGMACIIGTNGFPPASQATTMYMCTSCFVNETCGVEGPDKNTDIIYMSQDCRLERVDYSPGPGATIKIVYKTKGRW